MAAMSVIELSEPAGLVVGQTPDVDIVVPVYNEVAQIETSVRALYEFVNREFPFTARITIADNASTDDTWSKAQALANALPGVRAIHLDQKGRGRALRAAWSASDAAVVAYLDVDLSTGLDALLPLVAPLVSGHSDVAIGTRLAPGSRVVRGPRREIISRGYNSLLHLILRGRFSDAQCGFKALRRDVAAQLLPSVQDEEWFFDTELLVVAERAGMRIHEVPVDWVDDPDSRVDIVHTIGADLRGVWRMLRTRNGTTSLGASSSRGDQATSAELLRFAGVGVFSTLAYLGAFALLWPLVGAFAANLVAILGCGLANVALHRHLAGPGVHRTDRRHWVLGTAALIGISLAFTSGALGLAFVIDRSSFPVALVAVTLANGLAALARFWLLRTWVFRPRYGAALSSEVVPEPSSPNSGSTGKPRSTGASMSTGTPRGA
jgi:glycosyltransferase involved in cell wall biosynthesis